MADRSAFHNFGSRAISRPSSLLGQAAMLQLVLHPTPKPGVYEAQWALAQLRSLVEDWHGTARPDLLGNAPAGSA
jgi:hypothetical protein